jgi:hypothetical protein
MFSHASIAELSVYVTILGLLSLFSGNEVHSARVWPFRPFTALERRLGRTVTKKSSRPEIQPPGGRPHHSREIMLASTA